MIFQLILDYRWFQLMIDVYRSWFSSWFLIIDDYMILYGWLIIDYIADERRKHPDGMVIHCHSCGAGKKDAAKINGVGEKCSVKQCETHWNVLPRPVFACLFSLFSWKSTERLSACLWLGLAGHGFTGDPRMFGLKGLRAVDQQHPTTTIFSGPMNNLRFNQSWGRM